MASDLARGCNEQLINSQFGQSMPTQNPGLMRLSSELLPGKSSVESNTSQNDAVDSTTSYAQNSDDSLYNDETRRSSATEEAGVQNSSLGPVQGSTLAPSPSMENSGMMYILALVLPLVSSRAFDFQWRCTPSAMLRATALSLNHMSRFLRQVRAYLRQLAQDQIARDVFATAMDIILVVYAIGFLFLSLYQASIFA